MVDRIVLFGRLNPQAAAAPTTACRTRSTSCRCPYYESLAAPAGGACAAMARLPARVLALLDEVDVVWLLGPHPLAIVFAVLAAMRRKRVVLGVRQDMPRLHRAAAIPASAG